MQQYYRLGVLDNCHEKWSALADCLMLKTKRASDVQVSFFFFRVLLAVDVFTTIQTLVDKCPSQHNPPLVTYQRLERRKEEEGESVMQFFRKSEDLNFECLILILVIKLFTLILVRWISVPYDC